jgi:hypothetical protein
MVSEYDGEILSFSTGSYLKISQGGNLFNSINSFGYKTGIASSLLTINNNFATNETLIPAELLNITIQASAAKITNSSILNFNNLFSYKENQYLNEIILNIESAIYEISSPGADPGNSNNYIDFILYGLKDDDYTGYHINGFDMEIGDVDSSGYGFNLTSHIQYSNVDDYPLGMEYNDNNIISGDIDSYPLGLNLNGYNFYSDKDPINSSDKIILNINSIKDPLHSLDIDPNKYPDKDAPMNDNKETYIMRARDLNANGNIYRVWTVKETPDWTGEFYFGEFSGPTKNLGEIKIVSVLKE